MAPSRKMSSSPVKSVVGYEHLGNNIFLHDPLMNIRSQSALGLSEDQAQHRSDPSLIILCTWMGANSRQINKYVHNYQRLYPRTTILEVRTAMADFMGIWSPKSRRTRFASARVAMRKVLERQQHPREASVLLHIMSNGGCNTLVQLLLSAQEASLHVPLTAMIMDCCPGFDSLDMYYRAASHSLPKGFFGQVLGPPALYSMCGTITIAQKLNYSTRLNDTRVLLNDSALIPAHVRKLYLYSFIDKIVPWKDARQHAAEALARGYEVDSIMFESAIHTALLMNDEKRYTSAIRDFWNRKRPVEVDEIAVEASSKGQASAGALTDRGPEFSGATVLRSKL